MCTVLSFLRLMTIGDITKCLSPKNGKNWGFSPTEGDRINRSRRNLARKRIPWVCYRTPHLALIGKGGRYRSPQKSKFAHYCGFSPPETDTMTHSDEIWHDSVDLGSALSPNLALIGKRGSVQEPPKSQNLPKIVFWPLENDAVNTFR